MKPLVMKYAEHAHHREWLKTQVLLMLSPLVVHVFIQLACGGFNLL